MANVIRAVYETRQRDGFLAGTVEVLESGAKTDYRVFMILQIRKAS